MATKNYRKVKTLHENRRSDVSLEERWPVNGPKWIQRNSLPEEPNVTEDESRQPSVSNEPQSINQV